MEELENYQPNVEQSQTTRTIWTTEAVLAREVAWGKYLARICIQRFPVQAEVPAFELFQAKSDSAMK